MPEYLFSRAVFLASFAWALTVHFADTLNNKSESYLLRFGIVLATHIILFGLWWIITKTFLDLFKPNWVPILLFFVIAIGSGLRGLLFQFLLNYFDLSLQINYSQRAFASLLNITLVTIVTTVVIANLQAHRSSRIRLLVEADRLEFAKLTSNLAMEDTSAETAQQIKSKLQFKVSEMRKVDLPQILIQLRSMIDEVVRPLTRSLDESIPSWIPPQIDERAHRIGFKSVLSESTHTSQISYLFVPVFMYIFSAPSILQRTSSFNAFVVFPVAMLLATSWSYFVVKVIAPRWDSLFAYIFLTTLNGVVFGASTLAYTRDFENSLSLFLSALIFYLAWSLIVSFVKTLFRLNLESNQKLEASSNDLMWQVAHLREKSFQRKRRLAAVLHGQVQAKLASTYLQLDGLVHTDAATKEKVEILLSELERSIETIDSDETHPLDLVGMFQKVIDNWANIAHIELLASLPLLVKIQKDQVCTAALAELIPELCFNSIKHGKATHVSVDFTFKNERILEVIVSNDGISDAANSVSGLGSKMLTEISIFWDRKTENGLAVTRVELAYKAS
jgi:signal transduction histidine kinase